MAEAVEVAFGDRITAGLINVKDGHVAPLRRIELCECSHPVPDQRGVEGTRRIAAMVAGAARGDLVLCLISGGASALTPAPAAPVTLAEKQETTKLLLACGATIHEINAVRKHLSTFKGGQLARLAAPATVIALLLSDVIGDDMSVIGSGPSAPDESTFADAIGVLGKYGIWEQTPAAVRARLEAAEIETPKPGDPLFRQVKNIVVGSNTIAVSAAARRARELGYHPLVLSTVIEGETREIARMHAAIAREVVASGRPVKRPACVISGGETTVSLGTLAPSALGGRNQEFVLAAALDLAGVAGVTVLSGGTDGTDGPTDAAGAIGDGETVARAEALGVSAKQHLAAHDSYHFFEALGDLLKTGPTGTNVIDVRLFLIE